MKSPSLADLGKDLRADPTRRNGSGSASVRLRSRTGLSRAERRALLFIGDLSMVILAAALALTLWVIVSRGTAHPIAFLRQKDIIRLFWLVPLWFLLIANLYDARTVSSRKRNLSGLLIAAGVSLVFYFAIYFYLPPGELPRLVVLFFLVGVVGLEIGWRMLYIRLMALPSLLQPALVIGAGRAGSSIVRVLSEEAPGHFRVLGLIDDDPRKKGLRVEDVEVVGGSGKLRQIVEDQEIAVLILAITGEIGGDLFQALLDSQEKGIEIVRMQILYEELLSRVPVGYLDADWIMTSFVDSARLNDLYSPVKRLLDILGGALGTLVFAALLPFLALLIRLDSSGSILLRQDRAGKAGRPFQMLKFRTMVANAEPDGQARWAAPDDPRVTRLGRILRKTRLDEIPQFWNVLRGDMSLVGPRSERPELVAKLEKEIPFYRARLLVRPGLTGWAQVNYRYGWSVEDALTKLEYDLYYIRHRSLWLEIRILIRTLGTVLRFQGI
jgi:exopolysaccharide biosynthesis polyprenyl glycosylphosphotransferase